MSNQMAARSRAVRAPLQVELTQAARRALDSRGKPLVVEMELFFSCLVRKRLRWDTKRATDAEMIPGAGHENLRVWFHPVMAQHCALSADDQLEDLPLADFPLARKEAFTPHWLRLDYRSGEFRGDFGW
ncbi:MAG: hypothetical protein ACYDEV_08005 [Acidiferrobacter sp.]